MADEQAPQKPAKKKNTAVMTLIIVAVVALLEGGAFVVLIKVLGGGPEASYGSPDGEHVMEGSPAAEGENATEVVLLQRFRVPNNKAGFTVMYDIDLSVVVPAPRKEEMEQIAANRDAAIKDRVTTVIRDASPRVLSEDDLGTLRVMLKQALSEVVGDDQMIQRVLIPRLVPLRTD